MAASVNKVILVGNLGKDPEVRNTQDGGKIVNLSLATSETWNDKASGDKREKTEWHRIVIFNERIADVAEKYLQKGAKIYIEGALQTRKYTDQSGVERYTTEIVIGRFNGVLTMLSSRNGGDGSAEDGGAYSGVGSRVHTGGTPSAAAARRGASGNGDPSRDAPKGGDWDDEIPF